jgi:hypothetical protein
VTSGRLLTTSRLNAAALERALLSPAWCQAVERPVSRQHRRYLSTVERLAANASAIPACFQCDDDSFAKIVRLGFHDRQSNRSLP